MPPNRPPLRVVNGNAQNNPSGTDYKVLAITVGLTAAITTAVTMSVQWLMGRTRRSREENLPPQIAFPSPYMQLPPQQNMAPQGHVMIPVGASYLPPTGSGGYQPNPQQPQAQHQQQMPASLRFNTNPAPRGRRAANDDAAPAWLAGFMKEQNARFESLEAKFSELYEEEAG